MKKHLLTLAFSIVSSSCVLELKEPDVSGATEDQQTESTATIEGSVSTILNYLVSPAYAAVASACQSEKSEGSLVYANLIGITSTGQKVILCDTDIISGDYNFDINQENIELAYSALMVKVIDDRDLAEKQYENRKAIINLEDRQVDVNPETSILSEFMENIYFEEIFSSTNPKQMLLEKRADLTVSKVQTILPDIFSASEDVDQSALIKAKEFFEAKRDNSSVIDSIKTEVSKVSPTPIDQELLGDMCDINFKSSHQCYQITETCYSDYESNWINYDMNYGSATLTEDITPLSAPASCSQELTALINLHTNQNEYYELEFEECEIPDYADAYLVNKTNISICDWEKGFFLYTHGNKGDGTMPQPAGMGGEEEAGSFCDDIADEQEREMCYASL